MQIAKNAKIINSNKIVIINKDLNNITIQFNITNVSIIFK